jgi:hypothetical protein
LRALQVRHARLDILDLDGLGSVVEDSLGRPHSDGRWRARIDHRFQKSGGCRRGSLLEPRDSLAERGPASHAVGRLKLRHLEPAQKRIGPDASGLGGFLDIPLGEQRGDCVFLLAPETA